MENTIYMAMHATISNEFTNLTRSVAQFNFVDGGDCGGGGGDGGDGGVHGINAYSVLH